MSVTAYRREKDWDLRHGGMLVLQMREFGNASSDLRSKSRLEQHQPMRSYILIGDLIADSIEKAGDDVLIRISDEEKGDNELEFVNGMKLDRGYASPSSLTKRTKHVVCVVKPSTHELNNKRDILQDLTVLTGGQVVTGGFDVKLMPQVLGSCKELGGASGVNLHKMNITLDNARIAVKAALEEGIVPGGGVALLHASKVLSICSNLKTLISKLVLRFYRMLLRRLCSQLLSAAGFDGSIVVRKQLVQDNLVYENVFFMTRLAVVFTDISLDKAIEFNGLCHHQGRS
ncbi:chaperonin CPN60-2, mitochondrial-like [Citrus clementina]|uniref:chaperonin CPN60-2, mitochondrial-like n=1 Tax=Citrus clementina TaxID=85681 RepID=UPI000CED06A4|nr:chaperonin CPN60-2, mitochondrial-like [Citrus x clementina]